MKGDGLKEDILISSLKMLAPVRRCAKVWKMS